MLVRERECNFESFALEGIFFHVKRNKKGTKKGNPRENSFGDNNNQIKTTAIEIINS